jgi:hypothetical protein
MNKLIYGSHHLYKQTKLYIFKIKKKTKLDQNTQFVEKVLVLFPYTFFFFFFM